MKKRIWCLLFVVLMVLPLALAGCSSSGATDTSQENATRAYTTLSFWLITDEKTTPEAQQRMQDAFNTVCMQKYSTKIEFHFSTAEDYREELFAKVQAVAEETARLKSEGKSTKTQTEAKTEKDDDGMSVIVYPELSDAQLDIVLVTGKEMYEDLVEMGALSSLNTELVGTYKNIAKTVYPELLSYSAIKNNYYAIPNKRVIGTYTYLLVDRALAKKYNKLEKDITTVSSVYDLVQMIAENEDRAEVAPLLSKFDYPTIRFWSKDFTAQSMVGTLYEADMERGAGVLNVENLFGNEDFRKYATMMFDADLNDYCVKNGEKFAVGVVTGDYSARKAYGEDYICVSVNNPRVTEDDVYGAMFAVSKYTKNLSRSLEIIQSILTEEGKELRNILEYGEENKDFIRNPDGTVKRTALCEYFMNQEYTGSMFTVYPCTDLGQDADFISDASAQNRDHRSDVFLDCETYLKTVDDGKWSNLDEFSAKLFARLAMCVSVDEYRATVNEIVAEMDGTSEEALLVQAMLQTEKLGTPDTSAIAGCILTYARALNEGN